MKLHLIVAVLLFAGSSSASQAIETSAPDDSNFDGSFAEFENDYGAFGFYSTKKTATDAAEFCADLGVGFGLADLNSVVELDAIRAKMDLLGIDTSKGTEFWIGGKTSVGHHGLLSNEAVEADSDEGENYRILSNYVLPPHLNPENNEWNEYAKNSGLRKFICQKASCEKLLERFYKNEFDMDPTFHDLGECELNAKQCSDAECVCVKPLTGKRNYGKLEIPVGEGYNCEGKPTRCQRKRFRNIVNGADDMYIPVCTETGDYEPVQCQPIAEGGEECWCVRGKYGKKIKKSVTTEGKPDCSEYN